MMSRKPAVAGSFYPASPEVLRRTVGECLGQAPGGGPAIALLAPHAGYIYSGPCAGRVYAAVSPPRTAILLCPNHTGMGAPIALSPDDAWETPLGSVAVDSALAARLRELCADIALDSTAHLREHALEVQLPFLQVLEPSIHIVPICVGTSRLGALVRLGEAIARAVEERRGAGEAPLVVISSDMSHYISFEQARRLDALAIARMEEVDPEGLHATVGREDISMCGYCPAVAGLAAARALGARRGRLIAYTSSGDRTGDYDEVVAYAGLVFD